MRHVAILNYIAGILTMSLYFCPREYTPRCIEKVAADLIIKKMQYYFTICEEKNPGYRIIELICYCFLTNLRI